MLLKPTGQYTPMPLLLRISELDFAQNLRRQAYCLISIVPPESAISVAQGIAGQIQSANPGLLYVDCNAIAPQTTLKIGKIVDGAGGRYVDGGIIGSPPDRRVAMEIL